MCPPSKAQKYAKNVNQKQKQTRLSDKFEYKTPKQELLPRVSIDQNLFTGIPNLGNTCFFSVVLHLLSIVYVEIPCSAELQPIVSCLVALKNKCLTMDILKAALKCVDVLIPNHTANDEEDCTELVHKLFESSQDSNFVGGTDEDRNDYANAVKKRAVNFKPIMTYRQIDASCTHQQNIQVESHPYLSLTVLSRKDISFFLLPFSNPCVYTHVKLTAPGTFTIRKALKVVLSICDNSEDDINKWNQNFKRLILIKRNGDISMMDYKEFSSSIIWHSLKATETYFFIQLSNVTEKLYENIPMKDLLIAIVKLIVNNKPHHYYIQVPDFNESTVLTYTNFKISTILNVEHDTKELVMTCTAKVTDTVQVFESNISISYPIRENRVSHSIEDKLIANDLKSRLYSSDAQPICEKLECANQKPKIAYLGSCIMIHFSRLDFRDGKTHIAHTQILLDTNIHEFSLCGVILHTLKNNKTGHYIAIIKHGKYWYKHDDETVTRIAFSKISKSNIIFALYNK